MSKQYYIVPVFVPHEGCPHDCVFCNQNKISGVEKETNISSIKNHIDEILSTIKSSDAFIEIAYFGGSFTGIEKTKQFHLLETAKKYLDKNLVNGIRLSTRPDYISEDILNYLKEYGVTTIELGVQSLDNKVLELSNRGHNDKIVNDAVKLIKKYNFNLGLQIMPGLPGDTEETVLKTGKKIVMLNPNIVRIYPTLVIKGTHLEKLYNDGVYKPWTLDKTIEVCKKLLLMFDSYGIKVIRVGLQTSDNINFGRDIVAGPFHPSIRELIESEIVFDNINKSLEDKNVYSKNILLTVNPKSVSKIVGNKKTNLLRLEKKFSSKITLKQDLNLKKNNIVVSVDNNNYELPVLR
jgi:radical SAM enzyme (TIGR01210 family)